jgi:hypothetical protein
VTLRNPANGNEMFEVSMLIDSGADVSMIPQKAITVLAMVYPPPRNLKSSALKGAAR